MSRGVPILREISWSAVFGQLVVLVVLILVARRVSPEWGLPAGALIYLAWSQIARRSLTVQHRKGIALVRRQRFADALPLFRASVAWFDAHAWVDQARWITLLSPSSMGYREMGRLNEGFCLAQLGRLDEAREVYRDVLRRWPENGMAIATLRVLDAVAAEGEGG